VEKHELSKIEFELIDDAFKALLQPERMVQNGGKHLSTKKRNRDRRVVIPGDGDPCPRCGVPMQIREYDEVTKKKLRQPYFYTRWFCCMNKSCRTTLVMLTRLFPGSTSLLLRTNLAHSR
jgi:hypothetical protein